MPHRPLSHSLTAQSRVPHNNTAVLFTAPRSMRRTPAGSPGDRSRQSAAKLAPGPVAGAPIKNQTRLDTATEVRSDTRPPPGADDRVGDPPSPPLPGVTQPTARGTRSGEGGGVRLSATCGRNAAGGRSLSLALSGIVVLVYLVRVWSQSVSPADSWPVSGSVRSPLGFQAPRLPNLPAAPRR